VNPGQYNITKVYKGTTFNWLQPVWKIGGVPVNLTGWSADMQVRAATDTALIVELSTANGHIVIDGPAGKVKLTLSATETNALPAGTYQYELNLTDLDNNVYKILVGAFVVQASVIQ